MYGYIHVEGEGGQTSINCLLKGLDITLERTFIPYTLPSNLQPFSFRWEGRGEERRGGGCILVSYEHWDLYFSPDP